ncbi:hypothetical protein G3480_18730 [Thiorhodococcus mannitoliphagus]|uniref:Uncharacterized protein n=1 Tax=Thiorhodococcus mannitoliphagus TaxID=329406 RepID=A0A6P1E2R8_9GAMM|nr:hypothetical protein [Thiorhodococcus mannitoliphagus]NEX22314.1 hypothetical protein [Thiorhodococcus mannitoliphagus]
MKANEDEIILQFRYPWTMMPLESAGEWINAVSRSLSKTDPLYRKEIFVSARHETENLILADNDTDNNYAILSFAPKRGPNTAEFNTVEVFHSRKSLAEKLQRDHEKAIAKFK